MDSVRCPHCGTSNRAGSNFCNRCGTDLRAEPLEPAVDMPAAGSPPPAEAGGQPDAAQTASSAQTGSAETGPAAFESDQPWLEPGFTGADDVPFEPEEEEDYALLDDMPPLPAPAARLVGGVQGLLEPIRVAAIPHEEAGQSAGLPPAGAALDNEQMRRVRALLADEPVLASVPARPQPRRPALWQPWIFLIVGLAVVLPLWLGRGSLTGDPHLWDGIDAAYRAIDRLPAGARVQIFWAYDPATAGEMDLLSTPVTRHLLQRAVTLDAVALLPNAPATAQRIVDHLLDQRLPDLAGVGRQGAMNVRFLPGGVTILPLLGQDNADLAVVIAARAEDVQYWLEQVAPVNQAPVVAVTAAAADPMLRPYLDSGQLVGLVSGFDGGYHYAELMADAPEPGYVQAMRQQVAGQNYGILAILAIIALGNLATLLFGRRHDG